MNNPPHILIDARESGTSTGRYIDKLIEHIHAAAPDDYRFTVATKSHRVAALAKIAPNFDVQAADFKEFTFMQEQVKFNNWLKRQNADLVHFGKDHQPLLYTGAHVTTMHDLTTMRFTNPDKPFISYKAKQMVYKQLVKRVAQTSNHIITPTQFVKDDIITYTGVPEHKITVTHEAADAITEKPKPVPGVRQGQFIMYVGRPTPHKNLPRLIEAFKNLQQGAFPDLQLVLAGKLDNNYKALRQKTENEQIANIIYTDFITDGQLRWLYEQCAAYIFPSLSEGFGLPAVEAMKHGAPVVSSNATCLPEVCADAAEYFDPLNIDDMAETINKVLSDSQTRQDLIAAGYKRARDFSWQTMAQQTLDIYRETLAKA